MSGYFAQLAARALGEPALIAPPPRLRFSEAHDLGPSSRAHEEETIVTEAAPPAPPLSAPSPRREANDPPSQTQSSRPEPTAVVVVRDPPPSEVEVRSAPAPGVTPQPVSEVRQAAPVGRVRPAPQPETPVSRVPERRLDPPRSARREEPLPPLPDHRRAEPPSLASDAPRPKRPPAERPTLAPAIVTRAANEGPQRGAGPPHVTITIGQIELRAPAEKTSPPARTPPRPRERPRKPGLSLDEYLEQRSRR